MTENNNTPDPAAEQAAALAAADAAAKEAQDKATDDGATPEPDDVPDPAPKPDDAKPDGKADEGEEGESETLDTEKWGTTGDETGDSVLLMLQNSGVDPDVAKALLYDSVKAGDPTKIDRDALVEKVGKIKANLILAGIENYVHRTTTKANEIAQDVYGVAGGKENWDKVAGWVRKNVPEDKRSELASLIDAGGAKAKFAANEFLSLYNADEKNTSISSTTRIEGDAKAPSTGRAISKREYVDELEKAHRQRATPAAISEIQAARRRGRAKGL